MTNNTSNLVTLHRVEQSYQVSGELTRYSLPQLKINLAKIFSAAEQLAFDFTQVNKVDTAGLAWLCLLVEQAHKHQCQLSFANLPTQFIKLAKLSGVEDFLPIKQ